MSDSVESTVLGDYFAPFSNRNFFVKNRHFFFCDWINEYSLIQSQTLRKLHFFLRIFDENFSGFRAKFQKIVTCAAFSIKFAKQIRNLPKILNFVKIIHYSSKLFTSLLNNAASSAASSDGTEAGDAPTGWSAACPDQGRPEPRLFSQEAGTFR